MNQTAAPARMLNTLAQLPQKWDTTTWILLCVAAVATMYVMYRSRRRWKDPLSPRKVVPTTSLSPAQQRAVERQMQELLVELSDMSRQISGQLDTRAARLEVLIRQADERIARLAAGAASQAATSDTPASAAIERGAVVAAADLNAQNVGAISDASVDSNESIDQIVEPPAAHREVYALADEGGTPQAIAERLSRPRGEIELILALRPGKPVEQTKSK